MKNQLSFLAILTSLFFSLQSRAIDIRDLFSIEQRAVVVNAIDTICADTWCEGDYNYNFDNFWCDKNHNSCGLSFYFINTDSGISLKSQKQFCYFYNISNLQQILDKDNSIVDSFYDQINSCISRLEAVVKST